MHWYDIHPHFSFTLAWICWYVDIIWLYEWLIIDWMFPKQSNWKKLRVEWIPSMLTCRSRKKLWKAWNYAAGSFQNSGKSKYTIACLCVFIIFRNVMFHGSVLQTITYFIIGQTNSKRMMRFGKEVKTVESGEAGHLLLVWEQQGQLGDM